MLAIEERNDEVSIALLNRKDINLTLEDVREESALDYALKSDNSKILGEIRKRLANINLWLVSMISTMQTCYR